MPKSIIKPLIKPDLYTLAIKGHETEYTAIEVVESQFNEALVLFILKIFGVFLASGIMTIIGNVLFDEFVSDMLFSVLVLPLLYLLQSGHEIFEVFFLKVALSENCIIVKTGFQFETLDKLNLDTVENIELVTSPWGNLKDYGTLHIYSYGSNIRVPHIHKPFEVQRKIEVYIEKLKENNKKTS